jgi:hypothetical protein
MKLSLGAFGATCVVAFVLYACADSDESNATPPTDTGDASGFPAALDAGIDAPADAAEEADVSTPPKVCSDSDLCHLPLPNKEKLVAVWGDGAGGAWSASAEGSILELDPTGWKVHATDLGALVAIWGSGPTDIWAAGEKGVYHSTGAAFTPSTLPGAFPTKVTSIAGTAANDVWATGDTEDAQGDPVNTVLHWNGTAWSKVTVPAGVNYYRVWSHAASGVWLAGSAPLPPPDEFTIVTTVYRRAPGKTTFDEVTLPTSSRFPENPTLDILRDVVGAVTPNGTTVWIHAVSVSDFPAVIKGTSADGGATFTWTYEENKGLTSNPHYNAVFTADPNDGWAVGEWGQVRRWNGTAWQPQAVTLTNLPMIKTLNAVWASTDRAYIVGDDIAIEWRKP